MLQLHIHAKANLVQIFRVTQIMDLPFFSKWMLQRGS